ncbi:MAG: hypothetical protein NTV34_12685, partial [Proteobacteria bacterium]|nr:hypothetical protein [Pseudomonadota bacterium]
MRLANLVLVFAMLVSCPRGFAQLDQNSNAEQSQNIHSFATKPEGAVLPEKALRVRYIYSRISGQGNGYDSAGGKSIAPLDVSLNAGAIVFEYGLTPELSIQFLQNFVTGYDLRTNSERALDYTADTRSKLRSQFKALICAGLKVPDTSCDATIAQPPSASIAAALNASSVVQGQAPGISFDVSSPISTTVSNYVDAATLRQVGSSESSGARGLGGAELAFLWSPQSQGALQFSVGSGFRIPMNKDLAAHGENSITRDVPEFGLRTNIDYLATETLALGWQNQAEVGIASGNYKIGEADATFSRKGLRNLGFLLIKPSLAGIHDSLKMFGPKLGIKYDYGNERYIKLGGADTVSLAPRGHEYKYYAGLYVDFFPYRVPLQMELEYEKSFKGKNVAIAT